jgi:hypothetical protein
MLWQASIQSRQPGFEAHVFRSTTMAHFGCPWLVGLAVAFPIRRSKADLTGKPATEKHANLMKSRRFIIF